MKKTLFAKFLCLTLGIAVLAGCGKKASPAAESASTAEGLAAYKGQELVLQTWGGPWGESLEKIITEMNDTYGTEVKVLFHENAQLGIAKVRAMKDDQQIDIQMSLDGEAIAAANEGLAVELDPSIVKSLGQIDAAAKDANNKWLGLYYYPMGIIVRPDKVKNIPSKFADLWKPEYKGQIAIPEITWAGGHHAIVMAAMMKGGSEKNIDPGFKALADLNKMGNIKTFYATDDDVIRLIQSGEVGIAVSLLPNAIDFVRSGTAKFIYPADLPVRQAYDAIWAVKGGKEKYAQEVIEYLLGAKAQVAHSGNIGVLPVVKGLEVPAELKPMLPPAGQAQFFVDEDVCTPLFDAWTERFDKEVVHAK
jgi:spermidine/putrescine-binding protein